MLGGGEGLLKAERRKEEEIGISNVNNFNNATNALSVKSVVSVLVSVPFSVQFSSGLSVLVMRTTQPFLTL